MLLTPVVQIVLGLLVISAMMTVLWFVQRRTGNAGIVDAGWAASIGVLGVFYAATSSGFLPRRVLVAVLIGFWAARLAIYLLVDRVVGRGEDGRYRTLREQWGPSAGRRLFFFFQTQALAASFFALPVLIVAYHPVAWWTPWDVAGVLIWCISVGNTVLADRQLARFKRRPESRGKTCRDGWWRYSRHPNYFFEWLHWWSYVALAVGASYWWLTLLAPAAMLHFLLNVTGIPPTEAQALASRGEDYRQYQRTTSVFVPWFPKTEVHPKDNQEGK
jgi:steroid 5-alpha reductase family enzyme